jgi:hypothetical protein
MLGVTAMFEFFRVATRRSAAGLFSLATGAALLACGNSGGPPGDGGVGPGCASACTISVQADGDDDDSSEVPVAGGQATFPCDDAPIATYSSGGALPAGFYFSIGRSGSPDISISFTIGGQPTVASYSGLGSEVAYLVTGAEGPEFVSDPAVGGASTLTFCSVAADQTVGTSTTYTVHGSVQGTLAPLPVSGAGAIQGPVRLVALF